MPTKRLFVSVKLPQSVLDECKRIDALLKEQNLFMGRFVPLDLLHITLAFLGEIEQDKITAIVERLERIKWSPFVASLGSVDFLSSGKRIKVIFVPVISRELTGLAQEIRAALSDVYPQEKRSFVSHITLARVTQVRDTKKLMAAANKITVTPVKFRVDAFQLKESLLTPEGPVYTTLFEQRMF